MPVLIEGVCVLMKKRICNSALAATDEEVDEKEEVRKHGWGRDEIAFSKDWELKTSKSIDLEFMRMAEHRSKLTH